MAIGHWVKSIIHVCPIVRQPCDLTCTLSWALSAGLIWQPIFAKKEAVLVTHAPRLISQTTIRSLRTHTHHTYLCKFRAILYVNFVGRKNVYGTHPVQVVLQLLSCLAWWLGGSGAGGGGSMNYWAKIMSSHVAVIGNARAMTHLWIASGLLQTAHTHTHAHPCSYIARIVTNLIVLSMEDPISVLLSHVYAIAQLCQQCPLCLGVLGWDRSGAEP